MFTKNTISKFYKDVEALGLKRPVADISKATGYQKGTVSTYLSKKDEPSENFLKAFYDKFGESIKNVSHETENKAIAQGSAVATTNDDIRLILANLSESHKNLTAAHKEISESNNKLADNERMILSRMALTENGGANNQISDPATLVPLVEILAEMAAGKLHYRTKGEALAELGIRLSLHVPAKVKIKDSVSDASK